MHTLSTPNPAPPPPARAPALTLSEAVYREMRTIAEIQLLRERTDHTLQPTALVHEAYIRLLTSPVVACSDPRAFLAAAVVAVRRVLIDHARMHGAAKRHPPDGAVRLDPSDLEQCCAPEGAWDWERFERLDRLLQHYRVIDPRRCAVVELRVFAGLTTDQVATTLGQSRSAVMDDWRLARAWLSRAMKDRSYA